MKKGMLVTLLLMSTLIWAGTASQVTQYGITWTFDTDYEVGQFANGDWWVVGPVTIDSIDPPSREILGTTSNDGWVPGPGPAATLRTMNGSMINPLPIDETTQGYDSEAYIWHPTSNKDLNVQRSTFNVQRSDNTTIDIRVSTLPTDFGEKVVMRILCLHHPGCVTLRAHLFSTGRAPLGNPGLVLDIRLSARYGAFFL